MYLLYCAAFSLLVLAKAEKKCCDQPNGVNETIERLTELNNYNNDSIIDEADIQYDLEHRYDDNHDNRTSKMEYVLARNCYVGESYSEAESTFARIDSDNDGFVTVVDFLKSPIGRPPITVALFKSRLRARFQGASGGKIVGK